MSLTIEAADECIKRNATCDSCDTFVAMGDVTSGGSVIFGKNSDRPRGEVQEVITFQHQKHDQKEQKAESSFESISLKKKRNYKINYLK